MLSSQIPVPCSPLGTYINIRFVIHSIMFHLRCQVINASKTMFLVWQSLQILESIVPSDQWKCALVIYYNLLILLYFHRTNSSLDTLSYQRKKLNSELKVFQLSENSHGYHCFYIKQYIMQMRYFFTKLR